MTRILTALAAVLILSGCSIPTPLSVATMAFDVGSYVMSGKTMTDHGLSLVTQQDCQFSRIVDGDICRQPLVVEEAGSTLEPLNDAQVADLLDFAPHRPDGPPLETVAERNTEADPFVMGFVGTWPTTDLAIGLGGADRVPLRVGALDGAANDPLGAVLYLRDEPEEPTG
jgi:hypothetical protein